MAHGDGDLERVGELLEPYLPQTATGAVTPAAVGQDQQRIRQRVASPTLLFPPQTDTLDGKIRGVVAGAHIHKPTVEGYVVDAIRDSLTDAHRRKVMDLYANWLSLGLPGAPGILEVAHQFLLLRVDRDHWLTSFQKRAHLVIQVGHLRR